MLPNKNEWNHQLNVKNCYIYTCMCTLVLYMLQTCSNFYVPGGVGQYLLSSFTPRCSNKWFAHSRGSIYFFFSMYLSCNQNGYAYPQMYNYWCHYKSDWHPFRHLSISKVDAKMNGLWENWGLGVREGPMSISCHTGIVFMDKIIDILTIVFLPIHSHVVMSHLFTCKLLKMFLYAVFCSSQL